MYLSHHPTHFLEATQRASARRLAGRGEGEDARAMAGDLGESEGFGEVAPRRKPEETNGADDVCFSQRKQVGKECDSAELYGYGSKPRTPGDP